VSGAASASPPGQPSEDEFTVFFATWRRHLLGYLCFCGCPPHEADDIAQDSFLAVRGQWDHVRSLEQPRAYLFKVARRRFWRAQGQRPPGLYVQQDPDDRSQAFPDPADAFSAAEDRADLMAMIRQLPPRQGQVVWLRLVAGFSEAETAGILTVSAGTVKSQLHEGKAKLKELMRKAGGEDDPAGR
jgi:RNA polymerase sigma factor (sigma-70 family)